MSIDNTVAPSINHLLSTSNWLWAHASMRETTHFFPLNIFRLIMSLKDTTVYDKLELDNWEEWEQNTLQSGYKTSL